MVSYFIFDGKNSLDYKIGIDKCPASNHAARVVEKISVPGRSGDLIRDTGAFSNVTQPYEIWFKAKTCGTTVAARNIASWLLSGNGYKRLEDSYDPDVFRIALFSGPFDVENWMLLYGRATIEFDCKPQRYFKSGEYPISIISGQVINNIWNDALPLIEITGNGDGEIVIGTVTTSITGMDGGIILDSETQNAYYGTLNKNNNVIISGADFPYLPNGDTAIMWSGGITGVKITPRWWTI